MRRVRRFDRIRDAARAAFLKWMQNAEKDVASYVATLRGLALSCHFEQLSDFLIRDQIVRCAYNNRIREKLLMKDPNLDEAIQIAKRMEHTAVWLQEMDDSKKEGKQNVISEVKNKSKFLVNEEKQKSAKGWDGPDRDVCGNLEEIMLAVDGNLNELTSNERTTSTQDMTLEIGLESTNVLEKPHAQVLLNNILVKLLVDSGSLFTLI
ncbi:hypothetical protein NDU88_002028 [Pleurodeles waltl]|uniref:Uncharacterized protein n=1 Tax=Pleurodeles waltl TaxID=8319 RepID=A0AAV7WML0_PLEWA|nr:hypothetical protein NDU88_002028 [Pleurodeles waltl]